jgi:hypothetical protein
MLSTKTLAGLAPAQRLKQRVGVHGDAEPGLGGPRVAVALVFRLTHRLEPTGQRQGIAVVTPRRIRSQPVVGFHVGSVHSIVVVLTGRSCQAQPGCDGWAASGVG